MAWRAVLSVTAALVTFGLSLERLGLVAAIVLLTGIGALATRALRPLETALAALGLSPRGLRRVFLAYSVALGAVGTAAGAGFGVAICWVLTTFRLIRFEPDIAAIYFIDFVPFRVVPRDLLAVIAFALVVNGLASWIPAWRAGRLDPSAALRYE